LVNYWGGVAARLLSVKPRYPICSSAYVR